MDVLHDPMMMKKLNNGVATLSQTFYAYNLRTITKKKYFGHLGVILSKWILDHLKEDFFFFLTSLYLPKNTQ